MVEQIRRWWRLRGTMTFVLDWPHESEEVVGQIGHGSGAFWRRVR